MKPKIVFWGSPEFSLPAFSACLKYTEIIAVVTQPDKERGRGQALLPTAVKAEALKHNIPVYSPRSLRKADAETERLLSFLEKREADFYVVVAYGNLITEKILSLPLKTSVNIHGSLLPRWRGAAPIQRALEMGDSQTGVSLQRIVQELDAGDVYLEKPYQIQPEDKAATLFEKLSLLGAELITEFFQKDFSTWLPTKQDLSQITLAAKIDKKEAYWNSTWTADQIHNRIRAFHVWPTVKLKFSDKEDKFFEVKVHASKMSSEKKQGSSLLFKKAKGIFLSGSDGNCVELLSLQVPGKGPAEAFQVFQNIEKNSWSLISDTNL